MSSAARSILTTVAVFFVASISACGDDAKATSGDMGGASSGTSAGGAGGAGASGSGGSGNAAARDAAGDSVAHDAGSNEANGDGADDDSTNDAPFASCAGPTDPVDTYATNLTKLGKNGALVYQLVGSDPSPPRLGINTWTVKVSQADGGAVSGDLVGHVTMPNHTHPVTVQPETTFDPGQGSYILMPMYLYLSGYWRATLTSYAGDADAGEPVDTVDFNFCIE